MATLSQWIAGARPRTLPAAVAPVVVGTAAAAERGREQQRRDRRAQDEQVSSLHGEQNENIMRVIR